MARLLADENFPDPAVQELRRLGHDVATVHDIGRAGIAWPDEDLLAFARSERRAVVTLDRRDFARLHAVEPDHPGLVLCTFDRDFAGLARRIHDSVSGAGSIVGRLLTVVRPPR